MERCVLVALSVDHCETKEFVHLPVRWIRAIHAMTYIKKFEDVGNVVRVSDIEIFTLYSAEQLRWQGVEDL